MQKNPFMMNFIVFYLYCCTVHLVDSLIITQPTNAYDEFMSLAAAKPT